MYTELYLVSAGFLILEGDNLSNLFPMEEFQVVAWTGAFDGVGFHEKVFPTLYNSMRNKHQFSNGCQQAGIVTESTILLPFFVGSDCFSSLLR
ncbi:hypothetical protein TSUD_169850 [Trifolium subterraneum]|nr:hypothetical protein TSUD_169850 [Trifolium subterraneum]